MRTVFPRGLPVLEFIGKHPQRDGSRFLRRLISSFTVCENAGQFWNLCDPASVGFLLEFHVQVHSSSVALPIGISLRDHASLICGFDFMGGRSHPVATRRPSLVSRKRAKTCAARLPSLTSERSAQARQVLLSGQDRVGDRVACSTVLFSR